MDDIITNTTIKVRSKNTGKVYNAQYVVERPAGEYGMVWAWIRIDTEFGIFLEAYRATVFDAIGDLRAKMGHCVRCHRRPAGQDGQLGEGLTLSHRLRK